MQSEKVVARDNTERLLPQRIVIIASLDAANQAQYPDTVVDKMQFEPKESIRRRCMTATGAHEELDDA
jgi:hypothetical protein